jgi:hypothetical protein
MQLSFNLLAPLLVLLPMANGGQPEPRQGPAAAEQEVYLVLPSGPISRPALRAMMPFEPPLELDRLDIAQQVSIEQRVTIRITPHNAPLPVSASMFDQDSGHSEPRYAERKYGKCVPIGAIRSVRPVSTSKLLLIMRDQRLFTAELKKGCQARDYYSGFLVAKNSDGMICTSRDELRARSGTTCQVSGFRQIVETD